MEPTSIKLEQFGEELVHARQFRLGRLLHQVEAEERVEYMHFRPHAGRGIGDHHRHHSLVKGPFRDHYRDLLGFDHFSHHSRLIDLELSSDQLFDVIVIRAALLLGADQLVAGPLAPGGDVLL